MQGAWRGWLIGVVWLLLAVCRADDIRAMEITQGLDADFAANLRLQLIGQRVARAAELQHISFRIVNERDLNAFALPDGRVYVTSMMAHVVTDDELAFIVGHELTHVKEQHGKKLSRQATMGTLAGLLLALAMGGGAQTVRMGADLAGGLTYGHYSQQDENRADAGGIRLMARAGYDPLKAANAMQRLIDKYGHGDANVPVLGWFASHPDTRDRKQRLLATAEQLQKSPVAQISAPLGITVTADPSAEHAQAWLHDYLSIRLAATAEGRYVVMPEGPALAAPSPTVTSALAAPLSAGATQATATAAGTAKEEALPAVTVQIPPAPVAYQVTVSLRQIPAAGAATLEGAQGTAVEATLRWTSTATGFTGVCTAGAQTRFPGSWQAGEQLKEPAAMRRLFDGRSLNLEGTLEATALRRAAMAFAEILEADEPIDHGAPVTIAAHLQNLRVGDYVDVVRGDVIVAEVCVTNIEAKRMTGTVLWGTHSWRKKDQFVAAE